MKLRFSVNQAECFRRGINCDNSIDVLEVDPTTLPQDQRDLIADRLVGIDVVKLQVSYDGKIEKQYISDYREIPKPVLLEAKTPEFESLLEAAKENAAEVAAELNKSKHAQ